jgi:murein DD-endopeptidase MepM/ murein hydrolase activator NlpD
MARGGVSGRLVRAFENRWRPTTVLALALVAYALPAHAKPALEASPSAVVLATGVAPPQARPLGAPVVDAYRFPVQGAHDYGDAGARFGAGRGFGGHQGQDVFAECGTPVVAARGGKVQQRAYHGRAGNYLVIDGAGTTVDYVYAHLREPGRFDTGRRVLTGQMIGHVGRTGDATACHLHFEMWSGPGWYAGGAAFNPLPLLRAWDRAG